MDRAFGSSTVVLHCTGTSVPGAPLIPSAAICEAYLPRHIVDHFNKAEQVQFAQMIQEFIELIGIKSMALYNERCASEGWSTPKPRPASDFPVYTGPLVPSPIYPNSSVYKIRARASSDPLLKPATPAPPSDAPQSPPIRMSSPTSSFGVNEDEYPSLDDTLEALSAANAELRALQVQYAKEKVDLHSQIADLTEALQASEKRREELESRRFASPIKSPHRLRSPPSTPNPVAASPYGSMPTRAPLSPEPQPLAASASSARFPSTSSRQTPSSYHGSLSPESWTSPLLAARRQNRTPSPVKNSTAEALKKTFFPENSIDKVFSEMGTELPACRRSIRQVLETHSCRGIEGIVLSILDYPSLEWEERASMLTVSDDLKSALIKKFAYYARFN